MNKSKRHDGYCLAGLIAAATFLVYLRTLRNGFVSWDDDRYIYKNPHIHQFSLAFLKWAFFGFHKAAVSNWLPLTMILYAIDHAIWGPSPVGYHLATIILHSVDTFLVVLLAVRLIEAAETAGGSPSFLANKGKFIAAAATGLLFGLHPVHVESVAWASEMKDVLCALFFLLAVLSYIKYAASPRCAPEGRTCFSNRQYIFSLFFFALALMSKPMAVSLPLVLLILDWYPFGRISSLRSFRAAFIEKFLFIILSGGASVLTLMAQKEGGSIEPFKRLPLSERTMEASRSLVLYLWKMAFPLKLVPYYPYPHNVSFLSSEFFLPALFVFAVSALCLAKAGDQKIWLACWGYFLITLMPVIGLVQVGGQSMADRYLYLPSLGPFLLAGAASAWAWQKAGALKWGRVLKAAAISASVLAVLSMSYLTFTQIGVWKNSIGFYDYIIGAEPGRIPVIYNNRGLVFEKIGQTVKAMEDFNEAVFLDPAYTAAYNNRGITFNKMGLYDKAIADFNKVISLDPSYSKAYYNLGIALTSLGRPDLAETDYEKTIILDPSCARAYNNLGILFAENKQYEMALKNFNKAINLNPNDAQVYVNRGKVYQESGCETSSSSDFRMACGMGNEDGCRALRQMGLNGGSANGTFF